MAFLPPIANAMVSTTSPSTMNATTPLFTAPRPAAAALAWLWSCRGRPGWTTPLGTMRRLTAGVVEGSVEGRAVEVEVVVVGSAVVGVGGTVVVVEVVVAEVVVVVVVVVVEVVEVIVVAGVALNVSTSACGLAAVLYASSVWRAGTAAVVVEVVVEVVATGCSLPFLGFLFCFLLALLGLRVVVVAALVVVVVVVVVEVEAGTVATIRAGGGGGGSV